MRVGGIAARAGGFRAENGRASRREPVCGDAAGAIAQAGALTLDISRIDGVFRHGLFAKEACEERRVGGNARDLDAGQRALETGQRCLARSSVRDDLRQHRVVILGNLAALRKARVDAEAVPFLRHAPMGQLANRRQEPSRRVLGIEPRLDGVPAPRDFLLPQRQPLAHRHAQLPFHQIEAGDHFRHRMLDLEPACSSR